MVFVMIWVLRMYGMVGAVLVVLVASVVLVIMIVMAIGVMLMLVTVVGSAMMGIVRVRRGGRRWGGCRHRWLPFCSAWYATDNQRAVAARE